MAELTERQKQVLGVIWAYARSRGSCPTYSEIMGQLDLKSKQAVTDFLSILERKGYITKAFGKEKGISLSARAVSFLADKGTVSLGVSFHPNFDYLPDDQRLNSTHAISNPSNQSSSIEVPTRKLQKNEEPKQLSFFDQFNSGNKSVKLISGTLNNPIFVFAQNFTQNINLSLSKHSDRRKWNFFSKLKLSLKVNLDKLFGLSRE